MRRREFIAALGGTAAWPVVARAQQPTMPVIGYLDSGSPEASQGILPSLSRGLADAGYIAGKTITIEARWANGQVERLPALAKDLVNRPVDIIVAAGAVGSARAAKAATSTIPVVIAGGADPVRYGLVDSLARPGGNITGVTIIHSELAGKRLDLMHGLVPGAAAVGYLTSDLRDEIAREDASEVVAAARTLGSVSSSWNVAGSRTSRRTSLHSSKAGPASWSYKHSQRFSTIATSCWRWQRSTRFQRSIRNSNTSMASA
jgi:putative tryptophan/tyrosine transport system substrate-binding protein